MKVTVDPTGASTNTVYSAASGKVLACHQKSKYNCKKIGGEGSKKKINWKFPSAQVDTNTFSFLGLNRREPSSLNNHLDNYLSNGDKKEKARNEENKEGRMGGRRKGRTGRKEGKECMSLEATQGKG